MLNMLIPEHVFISYSHYDKEFAIKLATDLEKEGIQIWIDRTGLPPGTENWNNTIRNAISRSYAVLFLASPNSGQSSVVQGELNLAESKGCPIYPLWIAGKWEDSVPLHMLHSQYVDCRGERYFASLLQIIEQLKQVYTALPKHFSFNIKPDEIDRLYFSSSGYNFIIFG